MAKFDKHDCDWDHALETSERFFDGDTWVLMAGGSMKRISELHVGDMVMAIPHDNPDFQNACNKESNNE